MTARQRQNTEQIRPLTAIEKPLQFYNFLAAVAAKAGNLINYSSFARDIGIDVKTAQAWIGILERSGLVYLLPPYSPNITRRIIKTPKVYFLDTGLCAYLCRWETPETLYAGAMTVRFWKHGVLGAVLCLNQD